MSAMPIHERFVTEDQPVNEPQVVPLQDTYVMLRQLAGGVRTFLRSAQEEPCQQLGAPYSYSVWMRHLVSTARFGGLACPPKSVVELGPGSSLGTALAARLCGVQRYAAHEVVGRPEANRELKVLVELIKMFMEREEIPGEEDYPRLRPKLTDYSYPASLIDERAAADPRLHETLSAAVAAIGAGEVSAGGISFVNGRDGLQCTAACRSVDLLFSQAVMQYVDDLEDAYREQLELLAPGGLISHEIDFSAHETASSWNGHWAISDLAWRAMRGAKPYFLNRHPFSRHVRAMRRAGFEMVAALRSRVRNRLSRRQLAPRFRWLPEDDLNVRDALIIARRPGT